MPHSKANLNFSQKDREALIFYLLLKEPAIISKLEKFSSLSVYMLFDNQVINDILKTIMAYYREHKIIPTTTDGIKAILTSEQNTTVDAILENIDKLAERGVNKNILYAVLESRIKESSIKLKLTDLFDKISDENAYVKNFDEITNEIIEVLKFSLGGTVQTYNMGDIEVLDEQWQTELVDASGNIKYIPSSLHIVKDTNIVPGYLAGTVTGFFAPPGVGKTTLLLSESCFIARHGFKVLHVLIGDMMISDSYLRIWSNIFQTPQNQILPRKPSEFIKLQEKINPKGIDSLKNINVLSIPSGSMSVAALEETLYRIFEETPYDFLVIDYPDNLVPDYAENMYLSGGASYKMLESLSKILRIPVAVASQPKVGSWATIPTMGDLAESSKKTHTLDALYGCFIPSEQMDNARDHEKPTKGFLFSLKARRGPKNRYSEIVIDGSFCKVTDGEVKRGVPIV